MIKKHNTSDGKFWFTICAKNGRVLATSEMYSSKQARDGGVKSLTSTWPGNFEIKEV